MQQSVLLCISTILDSGNHYSKMMEMTDAYGHAIFESIRITLVCGMQSTWNVALSAIDDYRATLAQMTACGPTTQKSASTSFKPLMSGTTLHSHVLY